MIINAPAKLNLYLDVVSRRPDGYHNIRTIFERISLFDKIVLKSSRDSGTKIISDSKNLPRGKDNLAYRAASLLREDFNVRSGLVIEIEKNIPVGAGLGGGSSNAAATLLGLNRLWKLNLGRQRLLTYAARLGSDVAFFLYGISFALGFGRGERIKPLGGFKKNLWHIVVVPKLKVSTKGIYQALDRKGAGRASSHSGLSERNLLAQARILPEGMFFNRLEEVTFRKYPLVRKIKEQLIRLGLSKVLMSGSGSAVFGIVSSRKEGLGLAKFLKEVKDLRVFVVKTW